MAVPPNRSVSHEAALTLGDAAVCALVIGVSGALFRPSRKNRFKLACSVPLRRKTGCGGQRKRGDTPAECLGRQCGEKPGMSPLFLVEETVPVAILGTSAGARNLYRALKNFDRAGATQWTESVTDCGGIQYAIVAIPAECDAATEDLFTTAAQRFRHVFAAPQMAGHETSLAALSAASGELMLFTGPSLDGRETGRLKRLLDVSGALALGFVSLPFMIVAAVAICFSSKGPVLFKQVRVGKGNRAFTTLKFRTMYTDAAERLHEYLRKDARLNEQWTSVHKLKDDPRVTFIGRFLRRFSLDELPQLWNVLVGDMSLVGPRPIVVREIEKYGSNYAAYERARPGLTGLWQVSGRTDTTYQERVDYDSFYVRNWSLRLDARIIARTLRAVLSGAGAY